MKQNYTVVLLVLFYLFVQSSQAQEQEMIKAAQNQIANWLERIPQGDEADYGFKNRGEFKDVEINKLIAVYYYEDGQIKKYPLWRLPVEVDGEYRLLATMINRNNKYLIVDIGASVLARDIEKETKTQKLADVPVSMFRSTVMRADFLINTKQEYLPLSSARQFLVNKGEASLKSQSANKIYKEYEIINLINQTIDEEN
ncbi:MAG: hypothetical protein N4A71_03645 [Carboxylicivirga sp.]|jgi:hypothetical protein|nr:hypothetical protein [Carboxylicivirga sp.]